MAANQEQLRRHVAQLRACRLCPGVEGPPVVAPVPCSRIMLLGQAPGPKEREAGRPFVWRAGRSLFRWFATLGVDEETFRKKVYMAAVIRCFPGKLPNRQGDRKPAPAEIANCRGHLERELELLAPQLLLPVGRMAIDLLTPGLRLDDAVGRSFDLARNGLRFTSIPLPHPSGLSRWIQTEQGKALTALALRRIAEHPAWIATFRGEDSLG